MKWLSVSFDWNQAKAFLATAEEGSLSAAARALGLTQPTVGRQVAALEEELREMVKQGLGIGVMSKDVADLTPSVEVILPELVSIEVPVWLTTHRELHTSRRIRLVFDLLAEALS